MRPAKVSEAGKIKTRYLGATFPLNNAKMTTFDLQGHPFVTLTNLLKVLHLVGTGGEANIRIESGELRVNGVVATEKRKKLRAGDKVEFGKVVIEIR